MGEKGKGQTMSKKYRGNPLNSGSAYRSTTKPNGLAPPPPPTKTNAKAPKPSSTPGALNASVPPAKRRGAKFVRGFGEFSDK